MLWLRSCKTQTVLSIGVKVHVGEGGTDGLVPKEAGLHESTVEGLFELENGVAGAEDVVFMFGDSKVAVRNLNVDVHVNVGVDVGLGGVKLADVVLFLGGGCVCRAATTRC